jgi:pilus assembly protein CpaC
MRASIVHFCRLALITAVLLSSGTVLAQDRQQRAPLSITVGGAATTQLAVPVDKSQVLRLSQPFSTLSVGNPAIADVVPLTDRQVYVLGKAHGSTNLSIYGANKQLLAVVDIVVENDVESVKAKLHELMPGERIEVRSMGDSIVLGGAVSSAQSAAHAVTLAQRFAPDRVINSMRVGSPDQVMVAVKIAEVQRSVSSALGLKPSFSAGRGNTRFTFNTLDPLNTADFASGLLHIVSGRFTLDFLIDALEQRGLIKTLAEPNLVTMSGDTASFLAGGEFPVPVVQSGTITGLPTITVQFKPFGVSLSLTPTVIDGQRINMVVSPEVSEIDKTNAVEVSGFFIPGLSTRRATTTVELRDGEAFAIAGLLQSDFTDQVRGLPFINDVPVLGALFRSSSFQRSETELVILVTPRLVRAVPAGTLATPTDPFVPPSELDLYFSGRTEDPGTGRVLGSAAGGGLAGRYGHIIR